MATSGSIAGNAKNDGSLTSRYTFWVEWKRNSFSMANNTSNITVTLKIKCTAFADGAFNLETKPSVSLSVNGSAKSPSISYIDTRNYVECAFATWTGDVAHNDAGALSCPIVASFTHYGSGSLDAGTASGTADLDTIPRASTITSASSITLGNTCNIVWTPKAASFRYKLTFACGGWRHTTGAIHPNRTSAYTYTGYTLPLDVANQIPNDPTGNMTVTLYTYSDAAATMQIGSADSETFTFTVPENESTKPSVSIDGIFPETPLEAFGGVFVQGKSKALVTFYANGQYGADIVKYTVSVDGKTSEADGNFLSDYLSKDGVVQVKVTAFDSRGFSNSETQDIEVASYSSPKVVSIEGENQVVCTRCNADGELSDTGTALIIKAARVFNKVESYGTQNNYCSLWYRWKLASEPDSGYSEPVMLLDRYGSGDTYDGVVDDVVFNKNASYTVQIGVSDDMGESSRVTFTILSEKVYWHRGRDFLALGMHTSAGGFEVAWPSVFYGGVRVGDVTLEDYIRNIVNEGG